jgi:hypothetical protein
MFARHDVRAHPSRPTAVLLAGVGRGIVLVNANETMWQFFEHDELPAPPPS